MKYALGRKGVINKAAEEYNKNSKKRPCREKESV